MNLALKILFFSLIIDLSGDLGIRDIGFCLSIPFLFFNQENTISRQKIAVWYFVFILYPTLLLLKSNFDYPVVLRTQFFSTFQIFIIYLAIRNYNYRTILANFLDVIKIVQIFIIIVFFGCIFGIGFFENILTYLGRSFDGSYFGYLRLAGIKYPQIYFKSTLIFVFPAIYFFIKKKYINSLLSTTVLLITISKSGFILVVLGILFYSIKKVSLTRIIVVFSILIILALSFSWYLDILLNLNESYTATKRISQFNWFINYTIDNPISFLFGQGFGHFFNVSGVYDFAIELDHIDVIRKYGFLWFLIISLPFILCLINLRKNIDLYLPFILLYIAVGTNPLILTNIFFIIVLIILKSFDERHNNNNTYLEE